MQEEIDKARAIYYKVFSSFFVYTTNTNSYFELLNQIQILKESALDDSSTQAFENILSKLNGSSNVNLLKEYDNIFHNPKSEQIRTTASYYDEGVESGKKRVQMIEFLAKTKIRRDEKRFFDNEDSIGFILVVLSQLAKLVSDGETEYKKLQHCIFKEILNEFVDEVSKSIYEHEFADIYKDVIVAFVSFMEFERLYFAVSRVKPKQKVEKKKKEECELSQEEIERRARNKALKAQGPKKKSQDEPFIALIAEDV